MKKIKILSFVKYRNHFFKLTKVFKRIKVEFERAVDRQSKELGSNPSGVESVFISTERFLYTTILHKFSDVSIK